MESHDVYAIFNVFEFTSVKKKYKIAHPVIVLVFSAISADVVDLVYQPDTSVLSFGFQINWVQIKINDMLIN